MTCKRKYVDRRVMFFQEWQPLLYSIALAWCSP